MNMLLLSLAASLISVHGWLRGDDGRVQWDYKCSFQGQGLVDLSPESSSRCGELCLADASCSHWSFLPEDGGTCSLRRGASNAAVPHSTRLCGYLPSRFALDETRAFDLGLHLTYDRADYDGLAEEEAETALRLLNSFRRRRRKPKLSLDPRLILMAHELAATCRAVPIGSSMHAGDGYELLQLPGSLRPRGFHGRVHAVSVAAPLASSVKHAIEWWTSSVDPKTGTKPVFSEDVGVVGFAKRKMTTTCKEEATGSFAEESSTVWVLLLAQAD